MLKCSALPTGARWRRPQSTDIAHHLDLKRVAKSLQLVKVVLLPASRMLAREFGLLLILDVFLETKPGLPAQVHSASPSRGSSRSSTSTTSCSRVEPARYLPEARGDRPRLRHLRARPLRPQACCRDGATA